MSDTDIASMEEPPRVPLVPVSMHIRTEKPEAGWWEWSLAFLEEGYRTHEVVPWQDCGRERRRFETTLSCSSVFDPVPELHRFLVAVKKNTAFSEWQVDEEGDLVTMQVWNLDAAKVCLRLSSFCRDEDFCWHFVLERDAFLAELDAAYTGFGAQGGWGAAWDDWAVEDGYREEVIIDGGDAFRQS